MSCDLTRFGRAEMRRCGDAIARGMGDQPTLEGAARAMCGTLHHELRDAAGAPACVMVRCYRTHPYGGLPADLQRFAKRAHGEFAISPPDAAMRCLVLFGTVGVEPEWNDRRASRGHQAIPLPSPHIVERAPMIAQLVRELGFELSHVVRRTPSLVRHVGGDPFGVFHVEEAAGSPYIPAQAGFVDRYAIRSVLGFGGALPSGELFATILFARVAIPVETADRFRTLAREVAGHLASRESAVFEAAAPAEDTAGDGPPARAPRPA